MLLGLSLPALAAEENREFFVYDASNGLADNSAQIVICTKTGRMVVSTIGHINFFDGSSFTHVDPDLSHVYHIPDYKGGYQIYFDKFHHLWMKNEQMMVCVNLLTEKFFVDVNVPLQEVGVTQRIDDLYGDSECNMWFRSDQTLYSPALDKKVKIKRAAPIQDVDLYKDSLLLLFHGDGAVAVYDYRSEKLLYEDCAFGEEDMQRYGSSSGLRLIGNQYYQLRRGEHESVLLRYDIKTRQWSRLLERPFRMNCLCSQGNRLYIGSEKGYLVYDIKTGEVIHVETLKLSKGRSLDANINALTFDRQGGMWIGTARRGLLYAKPYPDPFHAFPMDDVKAQYLKGELDRQLGTKEPMLPRQINCVYRDSRGWTWTGGYNGLRLVKFKGDSGRLFTSKDGMTNEVVRSVIEDANHDIWASTSYGLARLMIRKDSVMHIETYINRDGVPSETFLNGRAIRQADGTIVMQSLDHIMTFNPAVFHDSQWASTVLYPKLVRVTVNGQDLEAGKEVDGEVIIDRAVSRLRELTIDYYQNTLVLYFSGLNYFRPTQTFFRVRVKGSREYNDWTILSHSQSKGIVDNTGTLRLMLTGLKPGNYEVEVQASMWPHVWVQEPFIWIIHVDEPWWRTTGLYVTLGILLLVLLILNFVLANRNTRLRIIRNNEEGDFLRRVRNYANRCEGYATEVLTPYSDNQQTVISNLSPEFVDAMLKIVPSINDPKGRTLTMADLSQMTGVEKTKLYALLSKHLDGNPRHLVGYLRLQKGRDLLATTKLSVEEIAEQCGFVSANYFISSFYHRYRLTPQNYRKSKSR